MSRTLILHNNILEKVLKNWQKKSNFEFQINSLIFQNLSVVSETCFSKFRKINEIWMSFHNKIQYHTHELSRLFN